MESLAKQYQQMHANPKRFHGHSIKRHLTEIAELVRVTEAETLLDYGCGRGHQYLVRRYHMLWGGILPHCYDPGVMGMSTLPDGPFDGVICNDVMEHVPEEEVAATLDAVFSLATRFVFLGVSTSPSHKTLPDGRDCHVTIRERAWWQQRVREAAGRSAKDTSYRLSFTEDGE
jgi:hypothetical protein